MIVCVATYTNMNTHSAKANDKVYQCSNIYHLSDLLKIMEAKKEKLPPRISPSVTDVKFPPSKGSSEYRPWACLGKMLIKFCLLYCTLFDSFL